MFQKEWIDFINDISGRLKELDGNTEILARIAKMTEEVGEFAGAAMLSMGYGRKSKIDSFDPKNLTEEFGDVVITACLLARELGLDLNAALSARKSEISLRWAA
ncbi:MAG: hypothetical protein LBL46_04105 [Rickettsiales bacterium]|jgi:NTP pyrophosphatase (non-canonical NTP hydrolase)|nr:hypothetical protein [Rickettsiales bacterium]